MPRGTTGHQARDEGGRIGPVRAQSSPSEPSPAQPSPTVYSPSLFVRSPPLLPSSSPVASAAQEARPVNVEHCCRGDADRGRAPGAAEGPGFRWEEDNSTDPPQDYFSGFIFTRFLQGFFVPGF